VEASALPASVGLTRTRLAIGAPLLRLRSDEQLVSLFRAGSDEAFRAIHDRYRSRMLGYTRQMLAGSPQDPEDAVQEIFVRAYSGLRANRRELALRAWLYRIAHNRCIDELRRPHAVALEAVDSVIGAVHDPVAKVELRDSLRRLIADVQRLPEQQRSALLMREMGGMAYADVAGALGVSVPAVKSLLVRARMGLAQASEARDTACAQIREDLIASHDRGVRASGLARRHMRDCANCREFRTEVRGVSRRFAALTPTLGPIGVLANLLGWGGGGAAAGTSAVAGGGTAMAGSGAAASAGILAGSTGHVVTLLAAAVVATGGAVEIQHTLAAPNAHRAHHHRVVVATHQTQPVAAPAAVASSSPSAPSSSSKHVAAAAVAAADPDAAAPVPAHPTAPAPRRAASGSSNAGGSSSGGSTHHTRALPISETLDPDRMMYGSNSGTGSASTTGSGTAGSTSGTTTTGSSTAGSTGTSTTSGTSTTATTGSGTTTTSPTGSTTGTSGTPGSTGTGTGTAGSETGGAPSGSGTSGGSTSSGTGSTSSGGGSGATSGGFGSTSVGGASSTTGAGSLNTLAQGR
jgi:RNA polymerase sigma factor (sigma-70 family)